MATPEGTTALARIAATVMADVEELGARLVDLIDVEIPELADDGHMHTLLAATVVDSLVAALEVFASGAGQVDVDAPSAALDFARHLAQHGVPITAMLRGYRLGQAVFEEEMITRIVSEDTPDKDLAASFLELSSIAFRFVDTVSEEVVAEYQRERDSWMRQRNASRLGAVRALLAGKVGDLRSTEKSLGYTLTGWHVGVVLWRAYDSEDSARPTSLEHILSELAAALACVRSPLFVAHDASTLWAWIPADGVATEKVRESVASAPTSIRVALGEPGSGPDGFRVTHAQARQAHSIALAAGPVNGSRVTTASEIGPLALLGSDIASAAGWVDSILGDLALDDDAHAQLRQTTSAYLASRGSLTAAAAELGVHKNTVQYRIRRAEQSRGRPFSERQLDVEVALLACKILGAAVLRPASEPKR